MTRFQVRKKLRNAGAKAKSIAVGTLNMDLTNVRQGRSKSGIRKTTLALAAVTVLGIVTAQSAVQAATVGFTSRADLAGNDSVDWGSLGSSFTTIPSPFTINSAGGNALTVSQPGGDFQRRDQDNGWGGNFSPGDRLLWTQGNGPITIDFVNPIARVGTQIQANFYGPLTAMITAFDSVGNSLGSFTRPGVSNANSDGSAIFIGIGSDTANISRLQFSLPTASSNPEDFAINNLSLRSTPGGSQPVPEPFTILGSLTAGGIGVALRRKRQQQEKETAKV